MAYNLARLPTPKQGEVDMYYVAVSVANMTRQVQAMAARLTAPESSKGATYHQEYPTPAEAETPSQHGDATPASLPGASTPPIKHPVVTNS